MHSDSAFILLCWGFIQGVMQCFHYSLGSVRPTRPNTLISRLGLRLWVLVRRYQDNAITMYGMFINIH